MQIPATSWRRLLSWSTDTLMFLLLAGFINPLMHEVIITSNWNYIPIFCGSIFMLLQAYLYTPLMQHYGGTIGERLWLTKCVSKENEQPIKIRTSLFRNLLIYWAVTIGLFLNGSMLMYANIHNSEMADKELNEELIHPSMTITEYTTKSIEWSNQWHNAYVYKPPVYANMFLTWAFIGSMIVFSVSGLFNKENKTILDKITHTVVIRRRYMPSTITNKEMPIKIEKAPKQMKFKFPRFRIDKSWFNTKISYMIYALIFVILVLYFKYYFDVKKEEKFMEIKYRYNNQ